MGIICGRNLSFCCFLLIFKIIRRLDVSIILVRVADQCKYFYVLSRSLGEYLSAVQRSSGQSYRLIATHQRKQNFVNAVNVIPCKLRLHKARTRLYRPSMWTGRMSRWRTNLQQLGWICTCWERSACFCVWWRSGLAFRSRGCLSGEK